MTPPVSLLLLQGVGPEGSDGQYTSFTPFQVPIEYDYDILDIKHIIQAQLGFDPEVCAGGWTWLILIFAFSQCIAGHQYSRCRRLPARPGQAWPNFRSLVQGRLAHAGERLSQGLEIGPGKVARGKCGQVACLLSKVECRVSRRLSRSLASERDSLFSTLTAACRSCCRDPFIIYDTCR